MMMNEWASISGKKQVAFSDEFIYYFSYLSIELVVYYIKIYLIVKYIRPHYQDHLQIDIYSYIFSKKIQLYFYQIQLMYF